MKKKKIAVTGHRPKRILKNEGRIKNWIREILEQEKEKNGGWVSLISGMAEGTDQIAALAAISAGVDLVCYYPYKKELGPIDEYFVSKAAEVRYVTKQYSAQCFLDRNRRMVDDCDLLLVVWDGKENGGTYYTYVYALEKGVPVILFPWNEDEEESC